MLFINIVLVFVSISEILSSKNLYELHSGTLLDLLRVSTHPDKDKEFGRYITDSDTELNDYCHIRKFHKAMAPFYVTNPKCLIHITNFCRHTDLEEIHFPTMIFNPEPLLIVYKSKHSRVYEHLTLKPRGSKFPTNINPGDRCPLSKYFNGIFNVSDKQYRIDGFCWRLDLLAFSIASKSLNCIVQIGIQVPVSMLHTRENVKVSHHNFQSDYALQNSIFSDRTNSPVLEESFINQVNQVSSSRTIWNVLVVQKYQLYTNHWKNHQYIQSWFKLKSTARTSQVYNEHFIFLLIGSKNKISKLAVVKLCLGCATYDYKNFQLLKYKLGKPIQLINNSPGRIEIQLASMVKYFSEPYLMAMRQYLLKCNEQYHYNNDTSHAFHNLRNDILLNGHADLWYSIFKNFSLSTSYSTHEGWTFHPKLVCNVNTGNFNAGHLSPIILEMEIYLNSAEQHFVTMTSEVPQMTMRFISCGTPQSAGLAFGALVSVYDVPTWLGIVLVYAAIMPITLRYLGKLQVTSSLKSNLIQSFRTAPAFAFMEQQDVFNVESSSLRVAVGAFLLMTIVLSNAYKNDNVYTMIVPLAKIPYETFDQLVKDGFDVYTPLNLESTTIGLNQIVLGTDACGTFQSSHEISWVQTLGSGYCANKTYSVGSVVESKIFRYQKKSSLLEKILNHTKLLPDKTIQVMRDTGIEYRNKNPAWKEYFRKKEAETLFQELKKCERSAIICQEKECWQNARRLKQRDNVYVGNEALITEGIGFNLRGWAPDFLLNRIKNADQSGMWDRWVVLEQEFLKRVVNQDETKENTSSTELILENEKLQKPTMSGNILVLFTILGCGQILACVLFIICEVPFIILIKYVFRALKTRLQNSVKYINQYVIHKQLH